MNPAIACTHRDAFALDRDEMFLWCRWCGAARIQRLDGTFAWELSGYVKQLEKHERNAGLTRREREVLECVRRLMLSEGMSPTLDEIGARLYLSKTTVHGHVAALEKKGLVERSRHRARGLKLKV